ncbi:hypothetical protein ILYODFUR_025561 [Ilyodon furcidens]|uniref:Uncharacterized protein n=1 Tax=Ilyodon furcidens TaxID=33524 RepID=A0ABV0TY18_9TELE
MVMVGLEPISNGHWARSGIQPGQVTSPSQGTKDTHKTNNHVHTHTSKSKLERPINLTVMLLDCGRKLEYLERIHARSGRTCRKSPEPGTVLTAPPPLNN